MGKIGKPVREIEIWPVKKAEPHKEPTPIITMPEKDPVKV